jgi:hypothetical protein
MSVHEIERAVSSLSADELDAFRRWFVQFDKEGWQAADAELESLLLERLAGPFDAFESNWKDSVRRMAAQAR